MFCYFSLLVFLYIFRLAFLMRFLLFFSFLMYVIIVTKKHTHTTHTCTLEWCLYIYNLNWRYTVICSPNNERKKLYYNLKNKAINWIKPTDFLFYLMSDEPEQLKFYNNSNHQWTSVDVGGVNFYNFPIEFDTESYYSHLCMLRRSVTFSIFVNTQSNIMTLIKSTLL